MRLISLVGILLSIPGFFWALYQSSANKELKSFAWAWMGVLSLIVLWLSVLYVALPGFFD